MLIRRYPEEVRYCVLARIENNLEVTVNLKQRPMLFGYKADLSIVIK